MTAFRRMRRSSRGAWRRWPASSQTPGKPQIVLTTVNAALQRVPRRAMVARGSLSAAAGNRMPMADLIRWLEDNGFLRTSTVREPGEYAVRGGILDLYAAGAAAPLRLDFFGDTLEFDPRLRRRDPAHDRAARAHRPGAGQRDGR